MTDTKTSLVKGVEVRTSDRSVTHTWEVPVRREEREGLTALVFHSGGGIYPIVTIMLSGADRIALIELLGGTYDVDIHH